MLELDAQSGFVADLAVVALIVILFRDGPRGPSRRCCFEGDERIVNFAGLCVFASILLHGLTDTPGSAWIARRGGRPAPER